MNIAAIPVNNHQNQNIKRQNVAFGYNFFLKDVTLPCAYCGGKMLSIGNIRHMAKSVENRTGDGAIAIIRNHYHYLDTKAQNVVDVLSNMLKKYPKMPIKEIILTLAQQHEKTANQQYESILNFAVANCGINLNSNMGQRLTNLIENSRKHLLAPTNNSEQKILRITYLQNEIKNLINASSEREKIQLRRFMKVINIGFNLIKEDSRTFFPKFGNEGLSSFFGSLFSSIRTTADHIVLASKKGECTNENYMAVCGRCNWSRANQEFKDFIQSHPAAINNIKKQFALLDAMLSPQFPRTNHFTQQTRNDIRKYLTDIQKTLKEQLGEKIKFDLPFLQ